jgi:undecaprenyl-diphosphatase
VRVAAWLLAALVIGLLARLSSVSAIDWWLMERIAPFATPGRVRFLAAITNLGRFAVAGPIALGAALALFARRRRAEACIVLLAALASLVLQAALKGLFQRLRPVAFARVTVPVGPSYPSGHTLTATAVFGTIALLLARRPPRFAAVYVALAALVIGAVGLSRMVLGLHWPTDVVGGFAAGLAIVQAALAWPGRRAPTPAADGARETRSASRP